MKLCATACLLAALAAVAGCRSAGERPGAGGVSPAEIDEIRAWAHYGRGLLYEAAEPESALGDREYGRSLALDPGNVGLAIRLARQYHAKRKPDAALEVLRQALGRNPDDIRLLLFLAYSLQLADRTDEAMAAFGDLNRRHPGEPAGYTGLCHLWLSRKEDAKAIAALERGFRKAKDRQFLVDNTLALAGIYQREQRWKEAIRCLRLAAEEKPGDAMVLLSLYQCYHRSGQSARADRLLQGVPADLRESPKFRFVVAEVLLGARRHAEALRTFEALARDLEGGPADLARDFLTSAFYYAYGAAAERAGDIPRAETLLEKSISLDPRNDEALNYLSYIWAERGIRLDRALDYVQRALEIEEDSAAYLDTLGWVYYRQKRPDLALTPLQRAHLAEPGEAVIADHLGDVLLVLGRVPEAVEHWRKSYLADPAGEAVLRKLAGHGADPEALRREGQRRRAAPPPAEEPLRP